MGSYSDFIITVGGQDATGECEAWRLHDSEESMSSLSVTLSNVDLKNSGIAEKGDLLAIRFGYEGGLGGKAELPIKKIAERGAAATIELTAHDEQEKLCGGRSRGMFKEGMSPREIQQEVCDSYDLKLEGESDGPKLDKTPFPVCNENAQDINYATERMQKTQSKGKAPAHSMESGGGQKPGSFNGDEWDAGHLDSGTGPHALGPDSGKELDENRCNNNANSAAGEQARGSIELRGYPPLKAKGCVDILGVGSRFSGKWYVKEAEHSWDKGSGYKTSGALIRGGSGKGGAGGGAPNVQYADIWNRGQIYVGPRKLDGESQAQFTWGRDEYFVDYEFEDAEQSQRGGGEQGQGAAKAVDYRNKGEVVEAKAGSNDDGEGGGE